MGIKIIISTLKTLEISQLLGVFFLGFSHPFFSIQTLYATLKTYRIAEKKFPETHQKNGRGNAFRHSLWSALIMMYCCKISSPQKSLKWCQKITTMHENLFPNELLLREMDIHNNQIGMEIFMSKLKGIHRQFFETNFFVDEMMMLSREAKLITKIEQIEPHRMVIVEDID